MRRERERLDEALPLGLVEPRIALAQQGRAGLHAERVEGFRRRLAEEDLAPVGRGLGVERHAGRAQLPGRCGLLSRQHAQQGRLAAAGVAVQQRDALADGGGPAVGQRRLVGVREAQVLDLEERGSYGKPHAEFVSVTLD
ncbi:hypothetical protein FQZ97_733010 [compost metagenome]